MDGSKEVVINWIIKESRGKLTIYDPEKRKPDLIVKKKAKYGGTPLSLWIETVEYLENGKTFTKNIPKEIFHPEKNLFLVFVHFDPIKREIGDYVWLIPSLEFEKITEENLKFVSIPNPQKKDKYSAFLIKKEDLADNLFKIAEDPESFKFSTDLIFGSKKVNLKKLKEFVTEARENTYARSAKEVDNPRLSGSSQLEYYKSNFFYRDIYFGKGLHFIGQETVYQNNKPVWCMVYMGEESPREVISFLKKSLLELSKKCRFGENCEFKEKNYKYIDKGSGTLKKFNGTETIQDKNVQVYRLDYMGGLLIKES